MIFHPGERVYWGAPEVIYLEGLITGLDEEMQMVVVHIERSTPHSAHLIGSNISFAANGIRLLTGDSPPGTTSEHNAERTPVTELSDEEKIRRAAAVAIHQQYGYDLDSDREKILIEQVAETINKDAVMRKQIIISMDEILRREF